MNVLILHNIYWTHYKAAIHSEMYRQIQAQDLPINLRVVHLAETERSRAKLGASDTGLHQYPHEVLYKGFVEDFSLKARVKALFQLVRQFQPNVVVTPGYFDPAIILVAIWCRIRGIRLIMSIDSTEGDHQRQGWRETLKRRIIGLADGFFCYGSLAANYMLRLGAHENQILLRRNAVDNDTIRQLWERTYANRMATLSELQLPAHNLIYVGRLIDRLKNITTLINAFKVIKEKMPEATDWGLLLVGDGEDKKQIATLCKSVPHAHIITGKSWRDVPTYLALSDALVLPSYSEPWGLVVNEAMVCKLPVLVSDRCGCAPDLVNPGVNGFVFDPYQPEQLVDGLTKLIGYSSAKRARMGEASAEMIAAYSPQAVAGEMLTGFLTIGLESVRS